MRQFRPKLLPLILLALCLSHFNVFGAAAAITASPVTGAAPLGVFFDGRGSIDASKFFWNFGDGLTSTDSNVTHIYTVSGTYTATLVVKDAAGNASAPAKVVITAEGPGGGVVTPGMNFRIAPFTSMFKLNRGTANADSFSFRGAFNTVDLPRNLRNVAMSFAINGTIIFDGLLDQNFEVANPESLTKPTFFAFVNVRDQLLNIDIKRASIAAAIPAATDETISTSTPKKVPVTLTLTIGAQTYSFTQVYFYSANKGTSGNGQFNLSKKKGDIGDGFFVVSQASAVEVPEEKAHFFEIRGYLAEPTGFNSITQDMLARPTAGQIVVTLNTADKIFIPFDRFTQTGTKFAYLQPDRQLGGVRSMIIDPVLRTLSFSTWDILALTTNGGTGLPVRGQPFTSFDFTLRMDINQPAVPAGTQTFSVVTTTRLSRKSTDDAFWQTGRKITRQ